MGWVAFPYFVFVELLAPVVEAVGFIGGIIGLALGMVNVPFAILYFLVAYGFGIVLSLATLLLEELSFQRYSGLRDRLFLVTWATLENLGYRQLTVVWRLRGIWKYLRGRTDWGVMERKGLNRATPALAKEEPAS
jgi:ABC-type transport system involved in cytochrome bd biosynthesis fused ATPase/permease subunit